MCFGIPTEAYLKQQKRLQTYWKTRGVLVAAACPVCGQIDQGQTGEYPCPACGLPRLWDRQQAGPRKPATARPGTKRKPKPQAA